MRLNALNRLNTINSFGAKKAGESWNPPYKADALFGLDGTVITIGENKYFKDKLGSRNFLISNLDWGGEYFSDIYPIFPFKTNATISAPAGDTTLIAADVRNFFYETNGTPKQLRPQQFFQNINYENQIYSKEIDRVVFPDDYHDLSLRGIELSPCGIKEIVMYSSPRINEQITECNSYFNVPLEVVTGVKWVDAVNGLDSNPGTKSLPYKTINKALKTQSTLTPTTYVKNGEYEEDSGSGYLSWPTVVWNATNGVHSLIGLGGVVIKPLNAANTHAFNVITGAYVNTFIAKGLKITNGSQNIQNDFYYQGGANNTMIVDKCVFDSDCSNHTRAIYVTIVQKKFVLQNSVIIDKKGTDFSYVRQSDLLGNYIQGEIRIQEIGTNDLSHYNKFEKGHLNFYQVNMAAVIGGYSMKYNLLNYKKACNINIIGTVNMKITHNYFHRTYTGESYDWMALTATYYAGQTGAINAEIKYNKIKDTLGTGYIAWTAGYIDFRASNNGVLDIQYNDIECSGGADRGAIIIAGGPVGIGSKINYNSFRHDCISGISMPCCESTVDANFVGVEVIGNYSRGNAANVGISRHGFLVKGKNCIVRNNRSEYEALSYVMKTNDANNDSFIFENNIALFFYTAFTGRAFNNCDIRNNIFAISSGEGPIIDLYAQKQECLNLVFSNNIINYSHHTSQNTKIWIIMRQATLLTTIFRNNIIVCEDLEKLYYNRDASAYYTYNQSISDGRSINNQVTVNPMFSDLMNGLVTPTLKLNYGIDLGVGTKTRLNVSTNWKDVINQGGLRNPVIIEEQDGDVVTQVGAYAL